MKDQLNELMYSIYAPMFAERDDLREAFAYAHALAKASEDSAAVLTAVHVVANTIAKEIEKINKGEQK
jgi:hemoglobin-like flavoprotein